MKKINPFLSVVLSMLFLLSCNHDEQIKESEFIAGEPIKFSDLKSSLSSVFEEVRMNQSLYVEEVNGEKFVNLENLNMHSPFVNVNQKMKVVSEEEYKQLRTKQANPLDYLVEQGFSSQYIGFLESLLAITENLESFSYTRA